MNQRTPSAYEAERNQLISHIRALLLDPHDKQARHRAMDHLIEVFEDEGLEEVVL